MTWNYVEAFDGGVLIGIAVTLMLVLNGRVAGISSVAASIFSMPKGESGWRLAFLGGLLTGGAILRLVKPEVFVNTSSRSLGEIAAAGLLVGFGTLMGSGCTSGHGICGVSRLSPRSLVATGVFMLFGFLTVALI